MGLRVHIISEVKRFPRILRSIALNRCLDDGRVDIDFNSRFIRTFSKCFPSTPDEDAQPAPPVYDDKIQSSSSTLPYQTWTVKLNIVIQVVGSRGDVQPFIALG